MFCPNCTGKLEPVKDILSQNLDGGDFYTHYCKGCNTYWHLHIHGDSVDLISTRENPKLNKALKDNLVIELSERIFQLEK